MQPKYVYTIMVTIFSVIVAFLAYWAYYKRNEKINLKNPNSYLDELYITQLETQYKNTSGYHPTVEIKAVRDHPLFKNLNYRIFSNSDVDNVSKSKYCIIKGDGNVGVASVLYSIYNMLRNKKSDIYSKMFEASIVELEGFAKESYEREKALAKNIIDSNKEYTKLSRYEIIKLAIFLRITMISILIQSKEKLIKSKMLDEWMFFKSLNSNVYDLSDRIDGLFLSCFAEAFDLRIVIFNIDIYNDLKKNSIVLNRSCKNSIYLINYMNIQYIPLIV